MTNAGGFVTHSATFEPYGGILEDSGTGSSLGFTGEMHDSTGLVYLRARYADPVTGTFLTRDPVIGVTGFSQTWNPYSYVRNNPINGTDPSGKFFPLLFAVAAAAVVGAAIGGAINAATQLSENGGRLDCIDKEELGMAILEGFIMGAVSGLTGGLTSAAGLTGMAAAIPMAIVDFGAGVIWDKLVRNVSDEEAITNGITNIAFGAAVDALSKPFAKMLSKAARMIKDKVADTRLGRGMGSAMSNFADSIDNGICRVGGKNSFSEDTPVLTENGDIPISEIKVGDEVLAYNEATGETGTYEVTATIHHTDPSIILLTIDDETLETTAEHPFYTDDGVWVNAADLEVGEQVYSFSGDYGTVESIEVVTISQEMYNLTVDEAHTFFVGDGEWLVHNVNPRCVDYSSDPRFERLKSEPGAEPNPYKGEREAQGLIKAMDDRIIPSNPEPVRTSFSDSDFTQMTNPPKYIEVKTPLPVDPSIPPKGGKPRTHMTVPKQTMQEQAENIMKNISTNPGDTTVLVDLAYLDVNDAEVFMQHFEIPEGKTVHILNKP